MLWKDVKLEERNENEPKFNPKNKTDRKIVITISIVVAVLLLLIAGLFTLYFVIYRPFDNKETASSAVMLFIQLIKNSTHVLS